MPRRSVDTPVGSVTLTETHGAITGLTWGRAGTDDTSLLRRAEAQLHAYFADPGMRFDLPLRVMGSPFQQRICAALLKIPPGETRSYGDLAKELGVTAQAVGQGCGANPIPILIPCHRVLGARGLGGFSGGTGIETKVALLRHEGAAGLLI